MSDVFVSYKAEDRRRVKPLVEALHADGYSVWWDEQIGGGAHWRHMIETELNAAKCVIVMWTKRSVGPEGTFVQDEATRAQQRRVYIPVLLDKVHLPLGFGEMQALPLTGWKGDRADPRYLAILDAVRAHAGEPDGAPAAAPVQKAPSAEAGLTRRAMVGGSAAVAAAVAGIGAWEIFRPSKASAAGTIAVLPFNNLSGDSAQAYFSDGIAEEIRSALGRIGGLKVAGSTSSEAVRNEDAQSAARKLGVANILTGSVRQSPSTIRVNAELIDGSTGLDKWSQDYDRKPGDAIKIQTDIAENVAKALSIALGTDERSAIRVGGTENSKAQKLVIEASSIAKSSRDDKEALQRAMQLVSTAIALDPNYADAYATKSLIVTTYGNGFAADTQELTSLRAQSLQLARKAIQIAPDLPRGYTALGSVSASNLDFAAAQKASARARQLAPNDPEILAAYANRLSIIPGKADEALQAIDKAIAADPLNPGVYDLRVRILFYARRFEESVRSAQQAQRQSMLNSTLYLADSLTMLGRYKEASAAYAQAPANYWWRLTGEAIVAVRTGNLAEARAKFAALEAANGEAASYQYGEIYAQMGDREKALQSLERAYQIKDGGLVAIQVDPLLDPVRSDPRYSALVSKMNFPTP